MVTGPLTVISVKRSSKAVTTTGFPPDNKLVIILPTKIVPVSLEICIVVESV